MSGPRRTIVFKTHLFGENGSSLTLLQSEEVRINTKWSNTGLRERQNSLLIAAAPWVMVALTLLLFCQCSTYWWDGEIQVAVWARPSPESENVSSSSPLRHSCLCARLMAKPYWNLRMSNPCAKMYCQAGCIVPCPVTRGATWLVKLFQTTTSFGNLSLCSQLLWVLVLKSQSSFIPHREQGYIPAFLL